MVELRFDNIALIESLYLLKDPSGQSWKSQNTMTEVIMRGGNSGPGPYQSGSSTIMNHNSYYTTPIHKASNVLKLISLIIDFLIIYEVEK